MQEGQRRSPDLTRRLPAEILAIVFRCWKDSCGSKRHGICADWVCSTWVCKRWREVALETPALWSSVLISRSTIRTPALETQLDRARNVALDLDIPDPKMPSDEVEGALQLVLDKKSPIRGFKIICDVCPPPVEDFVAAVAADLVSILIHARGSVEGKQSWQFGSDAFPRLRRLSLRAIIPTPGPPLLSLTQLQLTDAFNDSTRPSGTDVHRFLAACPNLEALKTNSCFEYDSEDMIDYGGKSILPVVALPKLRSLWMDELALDIATAVGTLRLPALTTFHLIADTMAASYDSDFLVIPQNITEALPPIRRSRCLSLVAGPGASPNEVTLSGGSDDTSLANESADSDARDSNAGDGDDWSVFFPNLDNMVKDPDDPTLYLPHCIGSTTGLLLARIPDLVVPSSLVRLELHISDGLPIARNSGWGQFFAAMSGLRTLQVGSAVLIRLVLAEFEDDAGLCPELEHLELCVGVRSSTTDGELAEFILRSFGTWVRGRATPLKSLTVSAYKDPDTWSSDGSESASENSDSSSDSDPDKESSSDAESASTSDEESGRRAAGSQAERDTSESAESWEGKLCRKVRLILKGYVHRVFLMDIGCPVCGAEYEPVEWDAIARGELYDGVTYY